MNDIKTRDCDTCFCFNTLAGIGLSSSALLGTVLLVGQVGAIAFSSILAIQLAPLALTAIVSCLAYKCAPKQWLVNQPTNIALQALLFTALTVASVIAGLALGLITAPVAMMIGGLAGFYVLFLLSIATLIHFFPTTLPTVRSVANLIDQSSKVD